MQRELLAKSFGLNGYGDPMPGTTNVYNFTGTNLGDTPPPAPVEEPPAQTAVSTPAPAPPPAAPPPATRPVDSSRPSVGAVLAAGLAGPLLALAAFGGYKLATGTPAAVPPATSPVATTVPPTVPVTINPGTQQIDVKWKLVGFNKDGTPQWDTTASPAK